MMRRTSMLAFGLVLALAACNRQVPDLDTRTFQLRGLSSHDAEEIIAPYVYGDREGAPGMISTNNSTQTITVRETADNLAKIARVLDEYDKGPVSSSVRLRFQVLQADGAEEVDPAIQDVEEQLRSLFRYEGYALQTEGSIAAHVGARYSQFLGQSTDGSAGFSVSGTIYDARETGDGTRYTMQVEFGLPGLNLLSTAIDIVDGQAMVLGTADPMKPGGALILVVRADAQS